MASVSGSLISRIYGNFAGVDFTNSNVALNRSPDSLNMWKNYRNSIGKHIETRPDVEKILNLQNVFGVFFYQINNELHKIVHSGTSLYDIYNETQRLIYSGMNPRKSQSFIYANIFYIKDGLHYLEYDGTTCAEVQGYVPTTTISKAPTGEGTVYEDVNVLTPKRKNSFLADGTSTIYKLDADSLSSIDSVYVNDTLQPANTYTKDLANGRVIFNTAPSIPDTDGKDNVLIEFTTNNSANADKIKKCTLLSVFDNRVFFSGNQDYPNVIFHSSLDNPRYVSDLDFYNEGLDLSPVKALIPGNNALWVCKKASQANTTIFYHNPTTDAEYGTIYPSTHSSISTGCATTGINFKDDIVFFSERGMEAITGDITTEQVLAHRSSLVDNKLLNENSYEDMILCEWEGYLLVFCGNKVYVADSEQKFSYNHHYEYEWYYWELSITPKCVVEKDGILYIGTTDGVYTLTNNNPEINSYWTTCKDEFNYPQYQKTTNKKGCCLDIFGESVKVSAKIDNENFEDIGNYENAKGYVVSRIKKKKWKNIQLKISSNKNFGLEKCTLEAFVGSYIKR
ncbi:MAG: hypothetical protein K6B70_01275 [Clostridia bacterium]|nr:hypothetical protein [Clostridia bacterium]